MADKSTKNVTRKLPGRPATGHDKVYTVRLPESLVERADAVAEQAGVKRSDVIRDGLEREVKRLTRATKAT